MDWMLPVSPRQVLPGQAWTLENPVDPNQITNRLIQLHLHSLCFSLHSDQRLCDDYSAFACC